MNSNDLLTVTDSFQIEGRGLVVVPPLAAYEGETKVRLSLILPDGTSREADALIQLTHFNRRPQPGAWEWIVLLLGLTKDAVPIGTRIQISTEQPAFS